MAEVCVERVAGWVEATPFRAHLAHVMAVGEMGVEVVAAMTGVSARGARHLLSGRRGRPVRRISAETGRRLLRLTTHDARLVRVRLVSARAAAGQLRELIGAGYALRALAQQSGVDEATLAALAVGRAVACSTLVAAQIAAVHVALGPWWDTGLDTGLDTGGDVDYPLAS